MLENEKKSKRVEGKYREKGISLEDLRGYVVNLEPDLNIPLREAMSDYKEWSESTYEEEERRKKEEKRITREAIIKEEESLSDFNDIKYKTNKRSQSS